MFVTAWVILRQEPITYSLDVTSVVLNVTSYFFFLIYEIELFSGVFMLGMVVFVLSSASKLSSWSGIYTL